MGDPGNSRSRGGVGAGALFLALVSALALGGCYVEATGGAYAVTGGNEPNWRVAPAFGMSVGVAYDAFVTRASAGAGGEAMSTRVAGADQVLVAGPGEARLELAPARIGTRGLFRIGGGVAAGAGQRFRSARDGSNGVEGRPMNAVQTSLMFSTGWLIGSGHEDHYLIVDLGVGPMAFFAWDNPGLTNLYAVGGEARITLSLPLNIADGARIGASVEDWARWTTTPEFQAEVRRRFLEFRAADEEQQRREQIQQQNTNNGTPCQGTVSSGNSQGEYRCTPWPD